MAAVRGNPPAWKKKTIEELRNVFTSYPVVALVGFRGVPAGQMQEIRRNFKDFALIKVTKNTLIEKALNGLGGEFAKLKDYIEDQTAIVATNMNPFKLFKKLEETKVPASLKPGQVSPVDVVVEKGPTPFPPGPVIGELQMAGLPAAIEKGKVVIKETVTAVKAGEVVKPEVARALAMLGIKPLKLGLELRAVIEDGIIFTPDTLAIDGAKVMADFEEAARKALNLAVNAAYMTEETAEILLMKAFMDARSLAVNAAIFEEDVMEDIIARAYTEMLSVASLLPDEALDEDIKERLSGIQAQAPPVTVEEEGEKEEEKEEEEEEKSEEEAIEGLGALFG